MLRFADDDFFNIVSMLAVRIPEMTILLLGIMLSLAYWRRHPRPALLSFLGFALLLLLILVAEPTTFLMEMYNPPWMRYSSSSRREFDLFLPRGPTCFCCLQSMEVANRPRLI